MTRLSALPTTWRLRWKLGLMALHAVGVAGCVAFAGGGERQESQANPGDSRGDDDELKPSPEDEERRERCRVSTEQAKQLLETHCASCHGGAPGQGGFDGVLDINKMIDTGRIDPGRPESSPVYTLMSEGAMPPPSEQRRPSADDILLIRDWIACGAPTQARASNAPTFIDLNERLEVMLTDLKSFDRADRSDIRYIDLYNLANGGYSEAELDVYRDAISFLMNSLSRGLRVAQPQRVDDRGLLYRIELSDYGWTADTWAALANVYPYAVLYNEDSQLFPIDEDTAERIREETGEPVPSLQADWFLAHAVRPPLYYELLNMPTTLAGLEAQLGIDIADNIARGRVDRAGFRQAGASNNDRVIERHELSASQGAFWISYDFADGIGRSDVYAHPLDFEPDGMQVAFNLPNGMMGYAIFDAEGARLDKAPNAVVRDVRSRDGSAEAGISCMSCHQNRGLIARADEVRTVFQNSGVGGAELEAVLSLYPPRETMENLFERDIERYGDARNVAVVLEMGDGTLHEIDDRHLDVLGLREVAAVLGIRTEELKRAIDASPQLFPAAVRALRSDGATVPRDGLEAVFPDVVRALRLGEPVKRAELVGGADGNQGGDDSDASDGGEAPAGDDGSDANDGDSNTGDDGSDASDAGTDEPPSDDGDAGSNGDAEGDGDGAPGDGTGDDGSDAGSGGWGGRYR